MTEREYLIDVSKIEELQMISDTKELQKIFSLSKSTIVQGGVVVLARISKSGTVERFDEISTEPDLEQYKKNVFKYL
ncbi:MAG: hypothetical protein LH478_10255 [Chitinophagaceae bacterium]|nr:hypothetical protein [Chitinophagaceae bacterium]